MSKAKPSVYPFGEFNARECSVHYFPDGDYPTKGYKPVREQSVLKVLRIGSFIPRNGSDEVSDVRLRANMFAQYLYEELGKSGTEFDLNYPFNVNIVKQASKTPSKEIYTVYLEVDYPRDTGSFLSQIATRSDFNEAVKNASERVRETLGVNFEAKIVHTGMTRNHD